MPLPLHQCNLLRRQAVELLDELGYFGFQRRSVGGSYFLTKLFIGLPILMKISTILVKYKVRIKQESKIARLYMARTIHFFSVKL